MAARASNCAPEYLDYVNDIRRKTQVSDQYFLADGFHRVLAARRNDWRDIDADVRVGTKTDALWFALAANKANGRRLTTADKKHAITLALQAWPDRSAGQLSEQIGCSQDWVSQIRTQVKATFDLPTQVTGKDGKTYPASKAAAVEIMDERRKAISDGDRVCDHLLSFHARQSDTTVKPAQIAQSCRSFQLCQSFQ